MSIMLSVLLGLMNGCATIPNATTTRVAGRQVEFALSRHDTPPVVFEAGLGGTFAHWDEVYPQVAEFATALVYNRAGTGDSDVMAPPRDGRHIVQELRELLASQGLAPPYVLVGHSLGGLYMQWYARYYPQEVAALILVDSTHPAQLKGKGATANWPFWVHWLIALLPAAGEQELAALDQTGEEILAVPPFVGGPVMVLSATQPLAETSELANDSNQKRKDLVRLYPGAVQLWVDSGHVIPLEKPESVIAAVRGVLAVVQPQPKTPGSQPPAPQAVDSSRD